MPKTAAASLIYLVEDDEEIREIVAYALRAAGFTVTGYENGEDFFRELQKGTALPALVLLDIMLPAQDGLSILKTIRGSLQFKTLPVIVLTAKGSEFDRVKGLDMGADDYLVKPFSVIELISRINAVLRRSQAIDEQDLVFFNITLNNARRMIQVDGQTISLTYKEFELLHYLLLNVGLVLARDKIMTAVWGYDFPGESRTLDMHIRTLRQKLGSAGQHIKTVRSVGYKLGE